MFFFRVTLLCFLLFNFSLANADEINDKDILKSDEFDFYVGTFDIIDEEGDEKTSLFGVEHVNENLYRDTMLGKFRPLTGTFITGDNGIYIYTGVEAEYKIGFITLSPSFSPGFYEAGNGKDLGSPLEFKSELKLGFNLFENSKISYSYNHISNNDWGDINPGANNEHLTFSTQF